MQVASRILLVWGVVGLFGGQGVGRYYIGRGEVDTSLAYSTMLIAWSATEVIRYGYFALQAAGQGIPSWLMWLRYDYFENWARSTLLMTAQV